MEVPEIITIIKMIVLIKPYTYIRRLSHDEYKMR